jgi:LuxR family maltose regulon positive regulatory protein
MAPRPLTVRRQRLLSVLDGPAAITVLRAPAGFGKSTLLYHWCAGRRDVLWPAQPFEPSAPGRSNVIDVRCAAGPVTLLLDDMDTVTWRSPDGLLAMLHAHPELRVVLAGRGGSWFPDDLLADLGATVIDADDLLFTHWETAEVLAQALPYLGTGGAYWADQVHRSTGGWPEVTAAVARRMATAAPDPIQMTSIATRTATDHLRHRLLPELERIGAVELALATAVTESFDAETAGSVAGLGPVDATLAHLVESGLIIGETVGGHTRYRWPDAAGRVLVDELSCREPGLVNRWHVTWARCLAAAGEPQGALRHAVAAGDWPLLVSIIDGSWRTLLYDDGTGPARCPHGGAGRGADRERARPGAPEDPAATAPAGGGVRAAFPRCAAAVPADRTGAADPAGRRGQAHRPAGLGPVGDRCAPSRR